MICATLKVNCLNCGTRMVPHELAFVCLKCEARIEVNPDWKIDESISWKKEGGF